MTTTQLNELSISIENNLLSEHDQSKYLEPENLASTSTDLTLSSELCLQALEKYNSIHGYVSTTELINKLSTMYQLSGTKLLRGYLYDICTKSNIHPILKTIAVKSLCYYSQTDELGYKAIDIFYPSIGMDISVPCKVEIVILLMQHKKYKSQAKTYFCDIINNDLIECAFRYKTILGLEHADIPKKEYFIFEACWEFLRHSSNMTMRSEEH